MRQSLRPTKRHIALGNLGTFSFLFLAWVIYTPIPFTLLKLAALGSIGVLGFVLVAGFKYGKWLGLAGLAALLALTLWPARPADARDLRARYLAALVAYQGTPYVWGGENARGLDCSGLIRRALVDALLSAGWHEGNPALWREAALVWWHDCSALEMKNGYGGRIQPLFKARSLNALNARERAKLQPGDLAVLQSGVHVLAFVGGTSWIQADPNLTNGGDKVIQTKAPSQSGWFSQRVVLCRWTSLQAP